MKQQIEINTAASLANTSPEEARAKLAELKADRKFQKELTMIGTHGIEARSILVNLESIVASEKSTTGTLIGGAL